MALVMSMGIMAFADDTGTLTVKNSEAGVTYNFYTMSTGLTFNKNVVAKIGNKTLTTTGDKPEMKLT